MNKPFYVPGVETHLIESRFVEQTYQIQVMQPLMRAGQAERFPVLYLTDGNTSFDFAKGISHGLQVAGQVRRFILVGIGYPGENPFAGNILRFRDFTSERRAEVPGFPRTSAIEGVHGIEEGKKRWHGAADFLDFIRHELTPFIDEKYPTIPGERAYAGHSLGGGLGLHALFSRADIFNRYILVSPSVSYEGDDHVLREAQEFISSGGRLDANVVMAVGEREEFDESASPKAQFVSNFFRLASLLHKARIPGLEFTSRIYPGETHASVWPIAFLHGIQAIFGPAECPPVHPWRQEPERRMQTAELEMLAQGKKRW